MESMMEQMQKMIAMQGGDSSNSSFNRAIESGYAGDSWKARGKQWGEADWDIWNAKKIDKVDRKELPTIVGLSIHPICKLCREDGYPTDIAALAYNKDCPIY